MIDTLAEQSIRGQSAGIVLSVCASCRKIRNTRGDWRRVGSALLESPETLLSHGYCPDCLDQLSNELDQLVVPCTARQA